MKTWNDYKDYVSIVDPEIAKVIKEAEEIAAIISAMDEQTNFIPTEITETEEWR